MRPVTPGQTSTSTYASPNSSNNQPTSLTQLSQERPIASGPMGGWEQVSRERTVTSGMSNTVEYSIIDQFCNPGILFNDFSYFYGYFCFFYFALS